MALKKFDRVDTRTFSTELALRGPQKAGAIGPVFLAKYRFISAHEQSANNIVTGFFQMSDPLGTPGKISNNVLTAQPTLALDQHANSSQRALFTFQIFGRNSRSIMSTGRAGST